VTVLERTADCMAVGMKAGPKINTHIRTYKILQKKEELISELEMQLHLRFKHRTTQIQILKTGN
jgi:ribosomal protein L29